MASSSSDDLFGEALDDVDPLLVEQIRRIAIATNVQFSISDSVADVGTRLTARAPDRVSTTVTLAQRRTASSCMLFVTTKNSSCACNDVHSSSSILTAKPASSSGCGPSQMRHPRQAVHACHDWKVPRHRSSRSQQGGRPTAHTQPSRPQLACHSISSRTKAPRWRCHR